MGFIIANLGTIIVGLIVAVVVGLVIFSLIRNKKKANLPAAVAADAATVPTAAHAISNYVKIQAEKERFR